MEFERAADGAMVVLPPPVAVGMVSIGNPLSALGLALFTLVAVLRLSSPRVRNWTEDNSGRFFAMLVPIKLLAILGAIPTVLAG